VGDSFLNFSKKSRIFLLFVIVIGDLILELNNESLFFASGYQKIFLLLLFATLVIAEKYRQRREKEKSIVDHSRRVNIQIFLFNNLIMNLLSLVSLLILAENYSEFGLHKLISNLPFKMFVSCILLDGMLYWWHRMCHRYKYLWMFHKVHHSDIDLNTTTTFRLHIVEVLLTTTAKALFIVIIGVPAFLVAFNEIIITAIVMINHTNISFWGEKLLAYVFIVPCAHYVHHSQTFDEHESNFGFALSIWDRMIGTYLITEPSKIGLPQIEEPSFCQTIFLNWKRNIAR
jgi:sterol desaturase/sphingolipid hydroxylase (fatty acid hydroxylase superfamily)